jgi:hypothetical protein
MLPQTIFDEVLEFKPFVEDRSQLQEPGGDPDSPR